MKNRYVEHVLANIVQILKMKWAVKKKTGYGRLWNIRNARKEMVRKKMEYKKIREIFVVCSVVDEELV